MAKKKSSYREAIERLREAHADKIEEIFLKMHGIATSGESDRDAVNAAKVCASLLGVPRPALEKETVSKKTDVVEKKASPSEKEWKIIEERLAQ